MDDTVKLEVWTLTNFQLPDSVKELFGDTVMILAETAGNIKASYLTGDND